jgi:hypothetical protein
VPAVKTGKSPVEQLTISLPEGSLIINWDQTQVTVPVRFS